MTWYQYIQILYNRFTKIGITDDLGFSEKLRIELSNQFIIIALPIAFLHLTYNILGPNSLQEYALTFLWVVILSIPLLLNHFQKYLFARIYLIAVPLLVVSAIFILFGWSLRLDFMYPMFILVSCYIFSRMASVVAIVSVILSYCFVNLHLSYSPPPLESQIVADSTYIYFAFATLTTIGLTAKVILKNSAFSNITVAQNKTLEEQNRELERFAYISSHDLKSPLSNIIGFSDLMEEELQETDSPEIKEYLSYIQTSSKQMYYLIEDILELSKIQNDNSKIRTKVDLNKIVEKAKYALTQEIQQKNAQVIYQKLPLFHCNKMEFSLLFQNLIQNGIKYNETPAPKIEIWAEQQKDTLQIFFKDNGIGIPAQYQEEIFEYFKRLHSSNSYQGTGIGLGLCKKIVQNYQGAIDVESTPKQGSIFILQFPATQVQI